MVAALGCKPRQPGTRMHTFTPTPSCPFDHKHTQTHTKINRPHYPSTPCHMYVHGHRLVSTGKHSPLCTLRHLLPTRHVHRYVYTSQCTHSTFPQTHAVSGEILRCRTWHPTLGGEGKMSAKRAEGSGKAGPSHARQACWEPKASPKERPPYTERLRCTRHCVHWLTLQAAGMAVIPILQKRKWELREAQELV